MTSSARWLLLLAAMIGSGASISVAERQSPSHTRIVTIEGLQFNPQELTVHRGDRVAWANKDLFPHTVTSDTKAFDSRSIAANASWSYVTSKPGEYSYSCTFHPTMKGKITVQ
jgi:plastocyanin